MGTGVVLLLLMQHLRPALAAPQWKRIHLGQPPAPWRDLPFSALPQVDASLHTPRPLCCPWAWVGFLALAVAVDFDGFGAVVGVVVVVQADHFCL